MGFTLRTARFLLLAVVATGIAPSWGGTYKEPKQVFATVTDPRHCREDFAALVNPGKTALLEKLRERYRTLVAVTAEDNRRFIHTAYRTKEGKFFFDAENAVLKELNDKVVRDKDLVTSLGNLYKQIFFEELEKDPLLRAKLIARYSDFKSVRLAFSEGGPELEAAAAALYARVGKRYVTEMKRAGAVWEGTRGLAEHNGTWHLAGMGATADEANTATRSARAVRPENGFIPARRFAEIAPELKQALEENEVRRRFLEMSLHQYRGMLTPHPERQDAYVLSAEAIKVLRNVKPQDPSLLGYVTAVKAEFARTYGISLSTKQALAIRDYVATVDRFSAGILAEERVILDLAKAEKGVVSVDFAGQGVCNLQSTMQALAVAGIDDASAAVRAARSAEGTATCDLNKRKAAIAAVFRKQGARDPQFSGDDGIYFPEHDWTEIDKRRFLQNASQAENPGSYRITFLPQRYHDTAQVIPSWQRALYIVHAEEFEKELRKRLLGRIKPYHLDRIMIAVDYAPAEHSAAQAIVHFRGDVGKYDKALREEAQALLRERGWWQLGITFP